MKTIVIAAAAVLGLGAWLRWSVKPVVAAFGLGRSMGLMEADALPRREQ